MKQIIYKTYKPKSVLNVHKHLDGGWFWNKYSAFPYMGCCYGCEYCYWRNEKYNRLVKDAPKLEDAFSQYIKVKENAIDLLKKELKGKEKEVIYINSYQPVEFKYKLVRKMLEVLLELDFPVFINEKSPLLLNDLDLLKKLSCSNVGFSIAFSKDDKAKEIFESKAPAIESRFDAMKNLSKEGITTGTVLMPVLPFICDDEENIKEIVKKTKESGGKYVLDAGLTLFGYCGLHFYKFLEKYDSSLVKKYKKIYLFHKELGKYYVKAHELVKKYCEEYKIPNSIPMPVDFYPKELQINKKIAEQFYLKSREIMLTQGMNYRQFAYLKTAWILDELKDNVKEIYDKKGKEGLMEIKGIGEKISDEIIKCL